MMDSLLHKIFDLGQEMASDLQQGNLDAYFKRVEQRGTLIEELSRYEHVSDVTPHWEEMRAKLQEQYADLTAALADQERRIQNELGGMHRFKGASRSYQTPDARPQILNENLRV